MDSKVDVFEVTENGVSLDEANFDSFSASGTQYKASMAKAAASQPEIRRTVRSREPRYAVGRLIVPSSKAPNPLNRINAPTLGSLESRQIKNRGPRPSVLRRRSLPVGHPVGPIQIP